VQRARGRAETAARGATPTAIVRLAAAHATLLVAALARHLREGRLDALVVLALS